MISRSWRCARGFQPLAAAPACAAFERLDQCASKTMQVSQHSGSPAGWIQVGSPAETCVLCHVGRTRGKLCSAACHLRVQRLRCPVAAAPPHPIWALTRQTILRLGERTLQASRKWLLRNVPSCCCVTSSRTLRGKRLTCGTLLLLHKQVLPAQATRRIHLAPLAPKEFFFS